MLNALSSTLADALPLLQILEAMFPAEFMIDFKLLHMILDCCRLSRDPRTMVRETTPELCNRHTQTRPRQTNYYDLGLCEGPDLCCGWNVGSLSFNLSSCHIPQSKHTLLPQHLQVPVRQQSALLIGLKRQLQLPGCVTGGGTASCPKHHVSWNCVLGIAG